MLRNTIWITVHARPPENLRAILLSRGGVIFNSECTRKTDVGQAPPLPAPMEGSQASNRLAGCGQGIPGREITQWKERKKRGRKEREGREMTKLNFTNRVIPME